MRDRPSRVTRLASAARQLNRDPRLVGVAKGLRERLVGDDRFADPLSKAPGRPADLAARELATLRGDAPGLAGELGLTAVQVWQSFSEHRGRGRGEIDVAIVFTDLAGFSSWALEAGDDPAIALLRDVVGAIEPPILARRGEVVKRLGDGLMAAFPDAASAAEAAFEAHERVSSLAVLNYVPDLRTGIHLGRPRKIGRDYFGLDVNIAARLAEAAEPGEVLVSDRTLRALDGIAESTHQRSVRAKGAPADLIAHTLLAAPADAARRAPESPSARPH
jgi:adenylate cyclase